MKGHDIIVIGASMGGVEALIKLTRNLPADLPAAVLIVLHISPYSEGYLAGILSRAGRLPATRAKDGEKILAGHIYVAPPDHHLMIHDGYLGVSRGPKENYTRPAIDPLFRTAADAYGPRVVGVVLTGELDNGTAGLREVKARGGVVVVQDPNDAAAPSMPRNALKHVKVDHCLPLAEIAPLLERLARDPVEEVPLTSSKAKELSKSVGGDMRMTANDQNPRPTFGFTCPECRGALRMIEEAGWLSFRCGVGHAFSAHSLLAEQSESLERTLWMALNMIEERAALVHQLAALEQGRDRTHHSSTYEEKARGAEQHAALIRRMLIDDGEWYSSADLEAA